MKGTIIRIVKDIDEILVQPDHGSVIAVTVRDRDENDHILPKYMRCVDFVEEENSAIRRSLLEMAPPGETYAFVGDRIRYTKCGSGSYVVQELLVKPGDPRMGIEDVVVEENDRPRKTEADYNPLSGQIVP